MSVDSVAARNLAQKRKEIEDLQNALTVEKGQIERQRAKEVAAEHERTDKELVQISEAAAKQVEQTRKLHSTRVRSLNENTQRDYENLAMKTAEQLKAMDLDAKNSIEAHRLGTMERLRFVTDQSEDPFYRLKSLNPVMSEGENEIKVKISLPEHEAQNLFVSGEGQHLKISLARKFQEQAKQEEGNRTTRTSSFQSIVESLAMPAPFDAKGIRKEYADGMVTITVPKIGPVV